MVTWSFAPIFQTTLFCDDQEKSQEVDHNQHMKDRSTFMIFKAPRTVIDPMHPNAINHPPGLTINGDWNHPQVVGFPIGFTGQPPFQVLFYDPGVNMVGSFIWTQDTA